MLLPLDLALPRLPKSFTLVAVFAAFFAPKAAHAQGFQVVLPDLSGPQLIDSVAARYRPATVLDYANARDTLYGSILSATDDSLRCIYSGHTLYLDPTQDPTQYIYLGGGTLGMNTEHAYPQSKGAADGNARSDMHHLYPARIPVNEARADNPYLDIPDAQTERWFLNAQVLTSAPPLAQRDPYSEWRAGAFEPRERVKGDLARSIFYFYTVYRAQANAADPNYFELQRATLCQWNQLDPADSAELWKTWRIAAYQDGKPNPYVLDCTLAARTWCVGTAPNCTLGAAEAAADRNPLHLQLAPHPVAGGVSRLSMQLPFAGRLRLQLRSLTGQLLAEQTVEATAGAFDLPLDWGGLQHAGPAAAVLEVELSGPSGHQRQALPVLLW